MGIFHSDFSRIRRTFVFVFPLSDTLQKASAQNGGNPRENQVSATALGLSARRRAFSRPRKTDRIFGEICGFPDLSKRAKAILLSALAYLLQFAYLP